ncbi:MAG TPA: helix-turn-helix domain-containing protein [Syntrophobacteraceae bacterium]|nr:helix-turn-helix domain-containing protein [Syntrophobacteraceae bacterium]
MDLTVRQAANRLKVSESKVRDYIASGTLPTRKKGRGTVIPEDAVEGLLKQSPPGDAMPPGPDETLRDMLASLLQKVAELERQVDEKWSLWRENRRLLEELNQSRRQLAEKTSEVERLQRDLLYQKRLLEKELQDCRTAMEEKGAWIEKQCRERIAGERELLLDRLALQEKHLEEKLEWEKEKYGRKLLEIQQREGFWSKLARMMTWS